MIVPSLPRPRCRARPGRACCAQKNTEELYGEAIKMMRVYQGIDDGEDEEGMI